MAEATIVSLVPREIREFKPGLSQEYVNILAAPLNDISILVVTDQFYGLYLDSDRGSRLIPEPVGEFARAIVDDFKIAQIEVSEEHDAWPGIFWVMGKFTIPEIKAKFAKEITKARDQQTRWFERLVYKADDDWAKLPSTQHISTMQKLAVKALNLTRPWAIATLELGNLQCPACTLAVPPEAALCPNCKCILNKEKAAQLAFAKG